MKLTPEDIERIQEELKFIDSTPPTLSGPPRTREIAWTLLAEVVRLRSDLEESAKANAELWRKLQACRNRDPFA